MRIAKKPIKKQLPKPEKEFKTTFSRNEIQEQFKQIAKQKSDMIKEQKAELAKLRVLNDKAWEIIKKDDPKMFKEKEGIVRKLTEFDGNINTLNIQMNFLMHMLNTKKEDIKDK